MHSSSFFYHYFNISFQFNLMGNSWTLVKLYEPNTMNYIGCTADAECYKANTGLNKAEATTDAEKAKRCCLFTGVIALKTGKVASTDAEILT